MGGLRKVGAYLAENDEELNGGEPKAKKAKAKKPPASESPSPSGSDEPKKPLKDVAAPEFEVSRLHNGQLEFVLLVRLVMDPELQGRLWPRLVEDHFAADTTRAIFKRLQTLHHAGREWPKLATLAMDPALPVAAQAQLKTVLARADKGKPLTHGTLKINSETEVPLETIGDFEGHVFDLLDAYRISRLGLEQMVEVVQSIADNEEFDPLLGPEMVERAATEVLAIRGQESISDVIMHFGHGTTEEDAAKRRSELRRMMQRDKPRFKTGIEALDKRSGGFQGGEVVLLGANTGGGKTAAALTMGINMARMGTSSAMCQLELSMEQMTERQSAHLASVNSEVIRSGTIPAKDQQKIKEAWDEFHEECREAKSRFTIYTPSSQTVAGCEMVFKQYAYKVWFVDYVNLINLGGKDADLKGWEKLSQITKAFKAIAKKYNICIVLLVQVNIDSDGNIDVRYAKAMKEDADIALAWNMTQEAKEEGVVWWQHIKARQYEPFDFPVRIELEYFRFSSFRDEPSRNKKKRLGKRKVHEKDDVDQVVETGAFQKKTKPLVVEDDRPIIDAALAGDMSSPKRALVLDGDDEYSDLDEE